MCPPAPGRRGSAIEEAGPPGVRPPAHSRVTGRTRSPRGRGAGPHTSTDRSAPHTARCVPPRPFRAHGHDVTTGPLHLFISCMSAGNMSGIPEPLITPDWLLSPEGRDYVTCILRKKKRRTYGLMERPVLPPQFPADVASYKIFVCGKSGVGKTSLIAKLCGLEETPVHHETTGIQTSCVYWPARPADTDRPIIFSFHFWDCGESALKKFDHILPACKEGADAVIFLFSFTDRSSFEDVPALIARTLSQEEKAARVVIGTKLDQFMHTDVTEQDIRDFQQTWRLPVMRVRSIHGPRPGDGRAELADAAPVLDGLAEVLWRRDRVTAGLADIGERGAQDGGRSS